MKRVFPLQTLAADASMVIGKDATVEALKDNALGTYSVLCVYAEPTGTAAGSVEILQDIGFGYNGTATTQNTGTIDDYYVPGSDNIKVTAKTVTINVGLILLERVAE